MKETISYTPEEVAQILKITRYTVYEMIKRGDLAAYRIGRKMRIEAPDIEAYIQKSKGVAPAALSAPPESPGPQADEFILCGQDVALDILLRHLEKRLPNMRLLRNYSGSIDGLIALYQEKANVVTAHLWDSDTDSYNTPYVRRLLPGHRTLIINLAYRIEGFYVAKGNPKGIVAWQDLVKPDVRFVNRERGSGARVLLDEKLRLLGLERGKIAGYDHEETSHLAVASYVARGKADVGLGIEKAALQVKELDFVPLQEERYDIVIRREDADKPPFRALQEILQSEWFHDELRGMGGYKLLHTGRIMAET